MKGILKFDLPEEREEFDLHCKAFDYAIALDEIGEYLRQQLKYCDRTEADSKVLEEVRDKLWEIRQAR